MEPDPVRFAVNSRREGKPQAVRLARQGAADAQQKSSWGTKYWIQCKADLPKLWRVAFTAPTDGANLSGIEDRGVKRKMCIFRFTPFSFPEMALIKACKGLIC